MVILIYWCWFTKVIIEADANEMMISEDSDAFIFCRKKWRRLLVCQRVNISPNEWWAFSKMRKSNQFLSSSYNSLIVTSRNVKVSCHIINLSFCSFYLNTFSFYLFNSFQVYWLVYDVLHLCPVQLVKILFKRNVEQKLVNET